MSVKKYRLHHCSKPLLSCQLNICDPLSVLSLPHVLFLFQFLPLSLSLSLFLYPFIPCLCPLSLPEPMKHVCIKRHWGWAQLDPVSMYIMYISFVCCIKENQSCRHGLLFFLLLTGTFVEHLSLLGLCSVIKKIKKNGPTLQNKRMFFQSQHCPVLLLLL